MPHLRRLAILTTLLAAAPAGAQDAGAFARYPFGARALGMGGAQMADVWSAASPYHNPALAPFVAGQSLEVSTARLAFSRTLEGAQVAAPLRPRAGVAAGFVHAGVTDIDGRDESGYHTSTMASDEYAFFLAFGVRMSQRVSAGLGLRVYRAVLPELRPSTSLGAGIGVTVRPSDRLTLALAVDDLFARYRIDASPLGGGTATDRFPVRVRLGAAWQAAGGRATVSAEGELRVRTVEVETPGGVFPVGGVFGERTVDTSYQIAAGRMRLGAEMWVAEPLALRLGYDRLGAGDFGDAAPSAGFAVRRQLAEVNARLDYAALFESVGPPAHVVSLHVEL
jgi:hypothetical protein